jgi:hypothetical protein
VGRVRGPDPLLRIGSPTLRVEPEHLSETAKHGDSARKGHKGTGRVPQGRLMQKKTVGRAVGTWGDQTGDGGGPGREAQSAMALEELVRKFAGLGRVPRDGLPQEERLGRAVRAQGD